MSSPRTIEIQDRIAKAALQGDEADRIAKAATAYLATRDAMLAALAALLTDADDDPSKPDFDNKLSSLRGALNGMNSMLDGITPSKDAGLLRNQLLLEESQFLRDIGDMDLGGARDALIGFRTRLRKETAELIASWQATDDQTQRIMLLEYQAAKDMADTMKNAIEAGTGAFGQMSKYTYLGADWVANIGKKVDAAVKSAVQKISDYARSSIGDDVDLTNTGRENLSDAGTEVIKIMKDMGAEPRDVAKTTALFIRNPGMVVTDYLEDGLKAVGDYIGGDDGVSMLKLVVKVASEGKKCIYMLGEPYRKARESYTSQLPLQGAILLCFSQARDAVDKFIDENGIETAQKYLSTVKDELSHFTEASRPPGLGHDASDFADQAKSAMETRINELQSMFSDFVGANRGRFIGEVDDTTQKRLIDVDNWNSTRDNLTGIGLDRRLQEWRAACMTITPEFENAWAQVQSKVASLPISFQSRVRDELERIHGNLRDQIAAIQDDTVKLLDAPQKDFDPGEINKVFDRRPLVDVLR